MLQRVFVAQAVADIGSGALEVGVLVDKVPIHRVVPDDVIGDEIGDDQVGLRGKNHAVIGQLERAVIIGRHNVHADVRIAQAAVGQPGPQYRVHFRHIRTP